MITKEEVIADITAIVAEKGADYVYTADPKTLTTASLRPFDGEDGDPLPTCYYRQYDGTPGCIVGQYIAKKNPSAIVDEGISASNAVNQAQLHIEDGGLIFLNRLQSFQDSGCSWGDALNQALSYVR